MSRSFRPIKEIWWGQHSPVFVESESLEELFTFIAGEAGCRVAINACGETTRLTVEDGQEFPDALRIKTADDFPAFFENEVIDENPGSVRALAGNIQACIPAWQTMVNEGAIWNS